MKRPAGSKNPENKEVLKAAQKVDRAGGKAIDKGFRAIHKGMNVVGGYLNKVSGAAMFDKGGKHGPAKKQKFDNQAVSGNSTKKTVRKPKNKF